MRLVKVTRHGEEYEKPSEKVNTYAGKAEEAFGQVAWEQDPVPQAGSQWTLRLHRERCLWPDTQGLICAAPSSRAAEGACNHSSLCKENLIF